MLSPKEKQLHMAAARHPLIVTFPVKTMTLCDNTCLCIKNEAKCNAASKRILDSYLAGRTAANPDIFFYPFDIDTI